MNELSVGKAAAIAGASAGLLVSGLSFYGQYTKQWRTFTLVLAGLSVAYSIVGVATVVAGVSLIPGRNP